MDRSERGYVLLSAIWLLILAGAIVSWLMLRSLSAAEQTKAEGEILRGQLAFDAATETLVADVIMNGSRSIWAQVPTTNTINVDGFAVTVHLTSEAERIDINNADARVIDNALRAAGLTSEERQATLGRIAFRRARGLRSLADLNAALQAADQTLACRFTYMPGSSISDASAALMNKLPREERKAPIYPGAVQRIELSLASGRARTVLLRILGLNSQGYAILDQSRQAKCF